MKSPVTKDEVKEVLADYPTKRDLKQAFENYPTKRDLKQAFENYPTKPQVEDLFTKFRDEIFERLDDISGQLETISEEQTVGYYQFKELEKKVDSHEERIAILESSHS